MAAGSRLAGILLAILMLTQGQAAHAARLTDLSVISVRAGVNLVPSLTADGRAGQIVAGWRENGNAHGYFVYMILVDMPDGGAGLVSIDSGRTRTEDILRDEPHTFEDAVVSVRFLRGRVDGQKAVLMVRASRLWRSSIPEPSETRIEVFRLNGGPDGEIGRTPYQFQRIMAWSARGRFCNADIALSKELGLPIPPDSGPCE